MPIRIPFNKPSIVGSELEYISASVASGHTAGDGMFSRKCRELLQRRLCADHVLLTTSCTAALEMSAILAEIGPGDEVIMPSYTFVSTANAFVLRGATIRFVDIRLDTLNMNEKLIECEINENTKAIVPVHYAGIACEMDEILDIARSNDLVVIEDAAQGVNARYKGKYLGTLADIGTYSFHETKNFICGEGGALLTNNERFRERAEIVREKGTNRSAFFRGQVDKYTWIDVGSSYLPSDLLAAFLFAQLERMEEITQRRRSIYELYQELLEPLERSGLIRLPFIPSECDPNYHMFYVLLESGQARSALIDYLRSRGVSAVFHYKPLHVSPMGRKMGFESGMLPVTEDLSERLLRLPFYFSLTEPEIVEIAEHITKFFDSAKCLS